jgi:hypothetical protein
MSVLCDYLPGFRRHVCAGFRARVLLGSRRFWPPPPIVRANVGKAEAGRKIERTSGRDAGHRAGKKGTHPTHRCIQHFSRFLRVRSGYAELCVSDMRAFAGVLATTPRTLGSAAP